MTPKLLDPDTPIVGLGEATIGDFWSWAFSDVLSNAERGVFAEFIVAAPLGIIENPRTEWDAVDLRYRGKTIEVKSSAYRQSWHQTGPSQIRFDIAKRKPWDAMTNTLGTEETRAADCYVFCLFAEQDSEVAHTRVIDLTAWEFYVLATKEINRVFGNQKGVGLNRIRALCDPVGHAELKQRIDEVLGVA